MEWGIKRIATIISVLCQTALSTARVETWVDVDVSSISSLSPPYSSALFPGFIEEQCRGI
jgi:hypothetical protein